MAGYDAVCSAPNSSGHGIRADRAISDYDRGSFQVSQTDAVAIGDCDAGCVASLLAARLTVRRERKGTALAERAARYRRRKLS